MPTCKIKDRNPQLDCTLCQARTCEGAPHPLLDQLLQTRPKPKTDPLFQAPLSPTQVDQHNAGIATQQPTTPQYRVDHVRP